MITIDTGVLDAFFNAVGQFSATVTPFMTVYIGTGVAFYVVREIKKTVKSGFKG